MATLHFIYGKPGSGKSTLARKIATDHDAVPFIEDEWLLSLYAEITSLQHFRECSKRVRSLIGPLAIDYLSRGTSVVFDFAANTEKDRTWVRSLFESAGADHVLHLIDLPDEECRRRVHDRNQAKPIGIYFGDVSDAIFDAVLPHIVLPKAHERFTTRAA